MHSLATDYLDISTWAKSWRLKDIVMVAMDIWLQFKSLNFQRSSPNFHITWLIWWMALGADDTFCGQEMTDMPNCGRPRKPRPLIAASLFISFVFEWLYTDAHSRHRPNIQLGIMAQPRREYAATYGKLSKAPFSRVLLWWASRWRVWSEYLRCRQPFYYHSCNFWTVRSPDRLLESSKRP